LEAVDCHQLADLVLEDLAVDSHQLADLVLEVPVLEDLAEEEDNHKEEAPESADLVLADLALAVVDHNSHKEEALDP